MVEYSRWRPSPIFEIYTRRCHLVSGRGVRVVESDYAQVPRIDRQSLVCAKVCAQFMMFVGCGVSCTRDRLYGRPEEPRKKKKKAAKEEE